MAHVLKRLAVGLVTCTVLGMLAACGSAPPATTPAAKASADPVVPQPAPLHWGACPASAGVSPGTQCAALKVPLDYSHPTGRQITLELSRYQHTVPQSEYLGAVLVNPGGPGASGLGLTGLGSAVPNGVGARYDWIGWDPRGVGASVPSIHCEPSYFGMDRPPYAAASERTVWLKRADAYAKACGKSAGALLDHMTTEDNARDMDVIREALRLPKIGYYGYSWGTYLGEVYASLFPTRVSRMVLDGVVDPRGVWYQANLDQDVAFQKTIKIFFTWVARNDSIYHLGATEAQVYAAYDRELAALRKTPNDGVGPDEFADAMLDAGYYVFNWDQDATNMSQLINQNDASGIASAYQQNNAGAANENEYAVYDAVQCTDAPWPGWSKTLADNERISKTAPFETWGNAWFNAPCLAWPAPAHTPVTIKASSSLPKILLIGETYDAATPFEGALWVRKLFRASSLIEGVDGSTHAGSLQENVPCTDNAIATYLATGQTPKRLPGSGSDLKCPPDPAPAPAFN